MAACENDNRGVRSLSACEYLFLQADHSRGLPTKRLNILKAAPTHQNHYGCVWFPVKVGWDMAVHILLDMVIQFFVWWSEYGDLIFCLVVGDEGGYDDPFFCLVGGIGWMSGYNHPFIRGGEYTPFQFSKPKSCQST